MSNELALQDLGREKLELIKQTVAKGATDLELELFMHACKRTGLDPLMKQMHAVKRWSAADKREVMSFQTGIDGYRLIADRTEKYAGSDEPVYEIGPDGLPIKATATVIKLVNGVPRNFSASAYWKEYAQKTREGQLTTMWAKMPLHMLGKCAEALALRKAFPAELSGIYTHEEMMQADEETPAQRVLKNKMTAQAKIEELRKELPQAPAQPAQAEAKSADSGYDAEWLSKVMDAEDFLRNSQVGKGKLAAIRAGFNLTGDAYPMFPDAQAEYLSILNQNVNAMQKHA